MKTLVLILTAAGITSALAGSPKSQAPCCTHAAGKTHKAMSCCAPDAAAAPQAEAAARSKKTYPLTTCIVSDEKLGEMGEPVVFTYSGQEIKLCCKSCRKKFDKDPATYLKKLEPKK